MERLPQSERALLKWLVVDGECWPSVGLIVYSGYCRIYPPGSKYAWAHRYSHELFIGAIDPGNVVDHLCERKRCCNPAHLEQCTNEENLRRYRERREARLRANQLGLFTLGEV